MAATPFSGRSWDIVRTPSPHQSPCYETPSPSPHPSPHSKRHPLHQSPRGRTRSEPSFEGRNTRMTALYISAPDPLIDFSLRSGKFYELVTPSWSSVSSSSLDDSRGSSTPTPELETESLSRQDGYSPGTGGEMTSEVSWRPRSHTVTPSSSVSRYNLHRSDVRSPTDSSGGSEFFRRSPQIRERRDLPECYELHALDANVLAYASFDDQIITSPNASWVPEYPLVDSLGITKRKDGFWGPQEYTRWPQLFVPSSSHHAFIPFRRSPDPEILCGGDSYMWFSPSGCPTEGVIHFVRDDNWNLTIDPRTGEEMCGFEQSFLDMLGSELDKIALKVHTAGRDRGVDGAKEIYNRCLRYGHSILDDLRRRNAPYRELILALRDVQRCMLELSGLLNYLDQFTVDLYRKIETRRETRMDIRGAFTTDPETVKLLYRFGVPVWFIQAKYALTRCVRILNVVKCDSWSNYLAKDLFEINGKSLWCGWNFNLQPKFRMFAESQLLNTDHMTELLSNIYQFQGLTCGPMSGLLDLSSKSVPNRTPVPAAPKSRRIAAQPCAQGKKSKAQPSAKVAKDASPNYARFLFVPTGADGEPDLPSFCPVVLRALTSLGKVGDSASPAALYPLPPPFFLVHHTLEKSAELYLNYLRIRPVLLDLLVAGGHFDKAVWRKLRDWRTILHGDQKKPMKLPPNTISPIVDSSTKSSSKSGKRRHPGGSEAPSSKRQRLADAASSVTFPVERELEPFDRTKPQSWRGRTVSMEDISGDKVLRQEVQWELMESLFRYEFVALDQAMLPRSRMGAEERHSRNRMINRIFKGPSDAAQSIVPDLNTPQVEYWGDKVDEESIYALRDVLKRWPQFPSQPAKAGTLTDADFEVMIYFYTKTFVRFFHRIPSMHCRTPPSLMENDFDFQKENSPSNVCPASNE